MHKPDLMFELSHPARIGILRLAVTKPIRHRDVLLGSGLAPSEVTRHVGRLLQSGLIKKDLNGEMRITKVGTTVLVWLDNAEFISFHSQYFDRHMLDAIPVGFDIVSILRKCEMLNETIEVVNAALQITAGSKFFINCIFDGHSDAMVNLQAEKLLSGNEINMITGTGRPLPHEYSEYRSQKLTIRTLKQVPFFLVYTEGRAIVCFRGSGGKIDYSTGFVLDDSVFLEWCDTLFNHFWLRGREIVL